LFPGQLGSSLANGVWKFFVPVLCKQRQAESVTKEKNKNAEADKT
jgi:hypothetical protein